MEKKGTRRRPHGNKDPNYLTSSFKKLPTKVNLYFREQRISKTHSHAKNLAEELFSKIPISLLCSSQSSGSKPSPWTSAQFLLLLFIFFIHFYWCIFPRFAFSILSAFSFNLNMARKSASSFRLTSSLGFCTEYKLNSFIFIFLLFMHPQMQRSDKICTR